MNDIDVLDRKEFVDKVIQIIEYYSNKSQSISFSIQGDWGCGKSWIVNKVYNELYDIQDFEGEVYVEIDNVKDIVLQK